MGDLREGGPHCRRLTQPQRSVRRGRSGRSRVQAQLCHRGLPSPQLQASVLTWDRGGKPWDHWSTEERTQGDSTGCRVSPVHCGPAGKRRGSSAPRQVSGRAPDVRPKPAPLHHNAPGGTGARGEGGRNGAQQRGARGQCQELGDSHFGVECVRAEHVCTNVCVGMCWGESV